MGMYDDYLISITCPIDGTPVNGWQGKDGPCGLYTWKPGELAPLEASLPYDPADDEPITLSGQSFPSLRRPWLDGAKDERLPLIFELHASHGDHWLTALGETDPFTDVWTITRLLEVTSLVVLPGEFWEPIAGLADALPAPKHESLRLWRDGVGLYPEAMARRTAEHERLRAALPAHGGDAICRTCTWRDKDARTPAVGWTGHYACEKHLSTDSAWGPDQAIR